MAKQKPSFNRQNCKGCALCVAACPKGLISLGKRLNNMGYHPAGLNNEEKCNSCGLCAVMCPDVVITLEGGATA